MERDSFVEKISHEILEYVSGAFQESRLRWPTVNKKTVNVGRAGGRVPVGRVIHVQMSRKKDAQ